MRVLNKLWCQIFGHHITKIEYRPVTLNVVTCGRCGDEAFASDEACYAIEHNLEWNQ